LRKLSCKLSLANSLAGQLLESVTAGENRRILRDPSMLGGIYN
jgi:hypothetical protein